MNKYMYRTLLVLLALALTACVNEEETPSYGEGGRLQLSLANISTATTRATPGEIGKPLVEKFWLRITNAVGRAVYDGVFTDEELSLPVGDYTVVATYGTNSLLAVDKPYYMGKASATIEKDATTHVSLTAKVANALVSVHFGKDNEEQARFDRFYSDYAVQVCVGNYNMSISKEETNKSIYVQAGSHVTLRFWGKLKMEDDREVSCELDSDDFPEILNAADHAIITLSLPDPESALVPDIAKVEVETVTLEETIPLSWLPVPTVTPVHQFDDTGNLVGTNLNFSNGYPGMTWRVEVTRKDETAVLRTVEGTGELISAYSSSADWPYLPAGTALLNNPSQGENIYTATYYIVSSDGTAKKASSRDFRVPVLTGLAVTVTGYTSYNKYLEGDIDAANACERLTVYEPSVAVNVANSLLRNSNYAYSFTYTYDGAQYPVDAGVNRYGLDVLERQPVRSTVYTLRGDATFDGVSATAQRDFRITGLPYSLNLKDHGEWDSTSGVDWFDNDVRLGHLSTGSQQINTNLAISLPPSTYYCADYNVNVHSATVGTTFSIRVGSQTILSIREDGGLGQNKDNLHSGTTDTFHDDSNYLTSIVCHNSYGAGQTCTHIYALTFKYSKP